MTTDRIVLWVGAVLIVAAIIFGIVQAASNDNKSGGISGGVIPTNLGVTEIAKIQDDDHTKGADPETAKVSLVKYSDFECPACGLFYPIVKEVEKRFGEDVVIAYRHYPLRQIHPRAQAAGQAAEAAGFQGKFWEMHDLLFERQEAWSTGDPRATFISYAKELGLDESQFEEDMSSQAAQDRVDADLGESLKLGLNATPTFFLDGAPMRPSANGAAFLRQIEEAIQNAQQRTQQ